MAEIADWNPRSVQRNVTGQTVDEWQKRLELAQKAGHRIGLWDWDLVNGNLTWSDETYRQFGFTRETFSGRVANAVTRLHPEDLPKVQDSIRRVEAGEPEYAAQYRLVRPDGTTRWIDAHGVIVRNGSAHVLSEWILLS
jgi:PAS domain S-box-containing protein